VGHALTLRHTCRFARVAAPARHLLTRMVVCQSPTAA